MGAPRAKTEAQGYTSSWPRAACCAVLLGSCGIPRAVCISTQTMHTEDHARSPPRAPVRSGPTDVGMAQVVEVRPWHFIPVGAGAGRIALASCPRKPRAVLEPHAPPPTRHPALQAPLLPEEPSPRDSESAAAIRSAGSAQHHLLKHLLTPDVAAAARSQFGPEPEEAGACIWKLQ